MIRIIKFLNHFFPFKLCVTEKRKYVHKGCNLPNSQSNVILGIFSVENIKRFCVFMFQTCSNSLLCTDSQYSSQQLTIGASLKHKNTQPLYIFNRENPQNSEPQNGPRSGLDYIPLHYCNVTYLISMQVLLAYRPTMLFFQE